MQLRRLSQRCWQKKTNNLKNKDMERPKREGYSFDVRDTSPFYNYGKGNFEEIKVKRGGGSSAKPIEAEPSDYDIPCVFLVGDEFSKLTTQKNSVNMRLMYVSRSKTFRAYISIKYQGNSSLSYPKKNFSIKLFSDEEHKEKYKVGFRNWPAYNKFVLKANWIDITQARNVVSARIWSDVVKDRQDYNSLPTGLTSAPNNGAIDGFLVKVYVNGIYQGRYTLNYGKDDIMFGKECAMAICSENYVSGCFREETNFEDGVDWSIEYPDVEKLDGSADAEKIEQLFTAEVAFNKIIGLCMAGDETEFKNNIGKYVDITSVIDYELFGRIITHLDGFGKNQMFLNYNGMWYATPYDLDSTFGLYWNGSKIVSDTYAFQSEYETGAQKTSNLLYDLLDKTFVDEIYARYKVLRKSSLSEESLIAAFEKFMDICPSELVQEDYASTTGEAKFTAIPSRNITSLKQLRDYIVKRCKYCDSAIEELYNNAHKSVVELNVKYNKVLGKAVLSSEDAATIHYTLDGSTPSQDSEVYVRPVKLTEGVTLKAVAFKDGSHSEVVSQSYEDTYNLDKLYVLDEYTEIRKVSDNYINTGVKLYETDKPFQVLLDVTIPNPITSVTAYCWPFLSCMKEADPWPGLICGAHAVIGGRRQLQVTADAELYSLVNSIEGNVKYIVTYRGNNVYEVQMYHDNQLATIQKASKYTHQTFDLPCLLGATWAGAAIEAGVMRQCDININSCIILNTPLEDIEKIKEAFNWEI